MTDGPADAPDVSAEEWTLLRPCLVVLSGVLAALLVSSLWWRMTHDPPLFFYIGWMMRSHGMVPYRDVFEPNAPGTFLLHAGLGALTRDSDVGVRVVDVLWTTGLGVVTWRLLRPVGREAAWLAVVAFGLVYFGRGAMMSFQRDYVCLLPVAGAALLSCRPRGWRGWVAVGALFGAVATVKPQLVLAYPIVLLQLRQGAPWATCARRGLASAAGFLVPVALVVGWLAAAGGLDDMLELFRDYNPLYLSLDGYHHVIENRTRHLARSVATLGGYQGVAGISLLGALGGTRTDGPGADRVRLLARLAVVFAIAPALAGQFWDYHWMPFAYAATCLAAIGVTRAGALFPSAGKAVQALLLLCLVALILRIPLATQQQLGVPGTTFDSVQRADEVGAFLDAHLEPGDTVQPLDWMHGAIQGMLIARAPLATSFVHDYQFFHDVSTPYIQGLRRRFIEELEASRPRFIIQVTEGNPRVTGSDTSSSFPELDRFLNDYDVVHRGDGWVAWERVGDGEG